MQNRFNKALFDKAKLKTQEIAQNCDADSIFMSNYLATKNTDLEKPLANKA